MKEKYPKPEIKEFNDLIELSEISNEAFKVLKLKLEKLIEEKDKNEELGIKN